MLPNRSTRLSLREWEVKSLPEREGRLEVIRHRRISLSSERLASIGLVVRFGARSELKRIHGARLPFFLSICLVFHFVLVSCQYTLSRGKIRRRLPYLLSC